MFEVPQDLNLPGTLANNYQPRLLGHFFFIVGMHLALLFELLSAAHCNEPTEEAITLRPLSFSEKQNSGHSICENCSR